MNLVVKIGIVIIGFYFLVSTRYVGNTLSCQTQAFMMDNLYMKHIIGLITLYTSVALIQKETTPTKNFLFSVICYILFIMTTRCSTNYFISIILLLFLGQILEEWEKYYETEKQVDKAKKIDKIQIGIYLVCGILLIIGFLIYLGQKKYEYGKSFDFKIFLLGVQKCKFNKIKHTRSQFDYIRKALS